MRAHSRLTTPVQKGGASTTVNRIRAVLRALWRPHYVFRPRQLLRRLRKAHLLQTDRVELAWGLPIRVQPQCLSGRDIVNVGVHDIIVAEAIARLLDAGELAIDVGANIGQNASIMACCVGPRGHVVAFEPHPDLWPILTGNIERWRGRRLGPITAVAKALGAQEGASLLFEPPSFAGNRGTATLRRPTEVRQQHQIQMTTLDACFLREPAIGLAKLDVEGYEEAVLQGGQLLLQKRRIRDLVFEDFSPQPGRVTRLLESHGYVVFSLCNDWWRPALLPWSQFASRSPRLPFTDNYLATLKPERARGRFAARGWRTLHRHAGIPAPRERGAPARGVGER
jgi:FkbM family methyltransferase